ncbi:MAG: cobalamin B12-binding domain-containing protein [Candidatus Niyogibacteria bacterium]|nr:cobalamin B12-binding domain-containing protein [Candidatus Niyogibacteria bacterium]
MASDKRLIIFLADLDHFRLGNRYSVPLGIGSITSYCRNIYGKAIDIFLFKNPNELMAAIMRQPPDILGCSFFMWNANLTLAIIKACKIISHRMITVVGGPNVARNSDRYKELLAICPELDIVVLDQGERSFGNILKRVFQSGRQFEMIFAESINGNAIRLGGNGPVARGKVEGQSIDINSFPSPYLMGYFDKFLQDGFLPTFETVRGCPYQCTFCGGGINSFLPLGVKNEQTVYDEYQRLYVGFIPKDRIPAD